ncbi:MAG: hypothetical protein B7Z66_03050 [Chromatiales bacterium 21-64-14]|nr:MAG: hypothetical protein B7Z66_03050 [Chromatiales bacterium 21-64-14]
MVLQVYTAGMLQGCAFVLIPALGNLLEAPPFGLSAAAYGALFLPMTGGAILSALAAGPLQTRFGALGVFRLGLACNLTALVLLASSAGAAGHWPAYLLLMAETAFLGLGFGLTLAAINHFAAALFPDRATAAVTVLNAGIGGSTALSPLALHLAVNLLHWWLWPALLAAGFALLLATSSGMHIQGMPGSEVVTVGGGETPSRRPLILFGAAVLIYAICEGTFGSWAKIYLSVTHPFPARYGAWALSAFWGSMTLFRVGLGVLPQRWLSPAAQYQAAPVTIGLCFLAVSQLTSPWALVAAYAAAGAACSIYYPYAMSFALRCFPGAQTQVAGVLVAALMAGEGIGSYALGPLQSYVGLGALYGLSALWTVPLLALAVYLTRYTARMVKSAP